MRLRANPHAVIASMDLSNTQPGSVDPGCAMNYQLPTATYG
jgi:hypothetical protein